MSYCNGTPLNGDESEYIAESWWGELELPTIDEVVRMILDFYPEAVHTDLSVR
jgi:hypothetical protein